MKHRVVKRPGESRPWKVENCGKYNMVMQFESWAEAMETALTPDAELTAMIDRDFELDGGW